MDEPKIITEDGKAHFGMAADGDIKKGTKLARVDGFWRAKGWPLTASEKNKARDHMMSTMSDIYALELDIKEANGLLYYINVSCIANAFNDFRGLAPESNCDLVTMFYANKEEGPEFHPTFRAWVESSSNIKDGEMCYVNYGRQRLLNMEIYGGADTAPDDPEDESGDVEDGVCEAADDDNAADEDDDDDDDDEDPNAEGADDVDDEEEEEEEDEEEEEQPVKRRKIQKKRKKGDPPDSNKKAKKAKKAADKNDGKKKDDEDDAYDDDDDDEDPKKKEDPPDSTKKAKKAADKNDKADEDDDRDDDDEDPKKKEDPPDSTKKATKAADKNLKDGKKKNGQKATSALARTTRLMVKKNAALDKDVTKVALQRTNSRNQVGDRSGQQKRK